MQKVEKRQKNDGSDPRYYESMRPMVVITYFASLAAIYMSGFAGVFPYIIQTPLVRAVSVVTASLTIPLCTSMTRGFREIGHVAVGICGALAGVGSMFLSTTSVLLGFNALLLPMLALVVETTMIALIARAERRAGYVKSPLDVAISLVLLIMTLSPNINMFLP